MEIKNGKVWKNLVYVYSKSVGRNVYFILLVLLFVKVNVYRIYDSCC